MRLVADQVVPQETSDEFLFEGADETANGDLGVFIIPPEHRELLEEKTREMLNLKDEHAGEVDWNYDRK